MSEAARPSDAEARERALDPAGSFIVQAPAGSGKTELLVQRYLRLLGGVDEPEEILALTFTRKAAGEMRRRVLDALERARQPAPEAAHERRTWDLAQAALRRDAQHGWDLAGSPQRLTINTIDSLCASLVRRMPWLSRLGGAPDVAEDPRPLYREAAERSLDLLESDARWSEPIRKLLERLDNDRAKAVRQLEELLGQRDQWLRHLGTDRVEREVVESGVRAAVTERLEALRDRLSGSRAEQLLPLARYAAGHLQRAGVEGGLAAHRWESLPEADPQQLDRWQALAELCTTKQGRMRKGVRKSEGFPAPSEAGLSPEDKQRRTEMKERMHALLAEMKEDRALVARLAQVSVLPRPAFEEDDWGALEALAKALLVAAGNLRLVFGERGQADYVEVAAGAITALGEPEAPTDLTLSMDARVRHLLVDEFQDTSARQIELLERLTAGWEPEDGRTLFAVGDPMQSIYAFRQADVGLFLRARQRGIGSVRLIPLRLGTNFRSRPEAVSWVNRAFDRVFPPEERIDEGGVCFSASTPFRPAAEEAGVAVHPVIEGSAAEQAEKVVELIELERERDPEQQVAVLVRARSHLAEIVPELRRREIPFQGVEIESLGERPVVQDLLALTRALAHPADRVAWLAVLRAPWCGLELDDLHAVAGDDPQACVWDLLADVLRSERLKPSAAARAARVQEVLAPVLEQVGRRPLHVLARQSWLRLGGPSAALEARDLDDAEAFFDRLARFEREADAPLDVLGLEEAIEELYAAPDAQAEGTLQLLTVHKAKGLEFDTVILPFLDRATASTRRRLVEWVERAEGKAQQTTQLLVAPIREAAETESRPIRRFVEQIQRAREANETIRLAYVAATRARGRLHLVGNGKLDKGAVKAPSGSTLLGVLWPAVEPRFAAAAEEQVQGAGGQSQVERPSRAQGAVSSGLRRLAAEVELPDPPEDLRVPVGQPDAAASEEESVPYQWARPVRRHVGTVVHRALEQMAREGLGAWDAQRVRALAGAHRAALAGLGVAPDDLPKAVEEVREALLRVLASERGRWLLGGGHREAANELALGVVEDGGVRHRAIDRTFVDDAGVRWVVDYKTGRHEGSDLEAFLEREAERYRDQLARYATAMRAREPEREVRAALYFPLHDAWCLLDV